MVRFTLKSKGDKEATLLMITQDQAQRSALPKAIPAFLKEPVISLLKSQQFKGERGEIFPLLINNRLILVCGLGKKEEQTPTLLRCSVRNFLGSALIKKSPRIEMLPSESNDQHIAAILEGVLIGNYSWTKYKASDEQKAKTQEITIVAPASKSFQDLITICEGVNAARDLVNDNADKVTAEFFEKKIAALIKGRKNIRLEILGPKELKQKGLHLHLAVNQGSKKEPRLIVVTHKGAVSKGNFSALIGKGITFDTGGLNLKPTGYMETMRCDMSGAAAIFGTLKNTIELNIKKNLIFVFGLAENAIGSASYKPGDVIKSYSGKTVEIGNTDAEGRLVLADAISYTIKNYRPERIVDIATLTGACVVALGHDLSGLISNNNVLANKLLQAAEKTDDRLWRLPSYPELKEAVKSDIADIKNTGYPKGAAGTLTAAEFLRQFTEDLPWAHIDIAGTAFVNDKARSYFAHGATGAGVRLLTQLLRTL